ncbi:hypothetical protein THIOKS11350041 [Thiocapsa sp. KS1]|nr:hypothetical protein THIOKS11350041 [Thiocapsa sp. KS1]
MRRGHPQSASRRSTDRHTIFNEIELTLWRRSTSFLSESTAAFPGFRFTDVCQTFQHHSGALPGSSRGFRPP